MLSFMPQPLYLYEKSPQYQLDMGLSWLRTNLEVVEEKKMFCPRLESNTPVQPITYNTWLNVRFSQQ
jgi:hypothetical protein